MKTVRLAMFAAALQGLAAMTNTQDNEMKSAIVPTEDGRGVAACVSVSYGDFRELPVKAVKGLWSLIVCVTQPIHPYHYVRDEHGQVIKDSDGDNKKVWGPFYRIWGKYQGDSVVGIVYDNRGTNGMAGGHWFAGSEDSGWRDKGGKIIGLALLVWGTREALEPGQDRPTETVVCTGDSYKEPTGYNPPPTPEPQPVLPEEWGGEGGPVGR